MIHATLRREQHEKVTLGTLIFQGIGEHPPIYTSELPWLDNKNNISCIPPGKYTVVPYSSKKWPNVWQLLDVEGRTVILIHWGNFACNVMLNGKMHETDTEGCILIGFSRNVKIPMVQNSMLCIKYLRNILGKNHFTLTIEDAKC